MWRLQTHYFVRTFSENYNNHLWLQTWNSMNNVCMYVCLYIYIYIYMYIYIYIYIYSYMCLGVIEDWNTLSFSAISSVLVCFLTYLWSQYMECWAFMLCVHSTVSGDAVVCDLHDSWHERRILTYIKILSCVMNGKINICNALEILVFTNCISWVKIEMRPKTDLLMV